MSEHSTQLAIMITCPPETMEKMVGESIFDYKGVPIGWIANDVRRPDEPEEVDTLKLHSRMNDVLLDMNEVLVPECHREDISTKELIDGVIAAHQIIEDAAMNVGTCKNISNPPSGFLCSECGWGDFDEPTHLLKDAKHCPNCGRKITE